MGVNYAPNVVRNGLVLYLDAANTKSYPGSGTTWTDLSGTGNNGTLVNGPTFSSANSGSIVLDGTNDYGTFSSTITASSSQTYEVYFKGVASASAVDSFGYVIHNNSVDQFVGASAISIGTAGLAPLQSQEIYGTFNGQWSTMGTGVISTSTIPVHVALSWDGATQKVYVNGSLKNSKALSGTLQNFSTTTSFGDYRSGPYRPLIGNIYSIRAYNRALSAAEVLQNFNATRSRYGI